MDNAKELARQKRVYLEGWLEGAKSIQKAVPNVRRQLDLAAWDENVLSEAPHELEMTISQSVVPLLEQDLETIHRVFPEPPKVDLDQVHISDVTASTTSMTIYRFAGDARSSRDSQIRMWGDRHCERYETLQGESRREDEVRSLLWNLKDAVGREFDTAASAYRMAQARTGTQANAGIAMRNVLEHYKGELMARTRHPNGQKATWEQMADRLVGDQGVARARFLEQKPVWDELHLHLTNLAKNRVQLECGALVAIFVRFVDHLYIVLSLAK
jgi:hypothetical protein